EHIPLQLESYVHAVRAGLTVDLPEGLAAHVQGEPAAALEDGSWAAHGPLQIDARPDAPRSADRTDARGEAALGLTVGESTLTGRARLRWVVLSGALEAVSFRAAGIGSDLAVTGTGVGEVRRSGDRVTVALSAPADTLVELDLRWTAPLPTGSEGKLQIPSITLDGARRTTSTLQLARDGEWEALPTLPGWTGRSASGLPVWGRGLVAGTPTAAFTAPVGGRGGTLSLLRFEPVNGPAAVVDIADYLAATSVDGRTVVRARYEVLNDRATELNVALPAAARLLSVRVRGEAARFSATREQRLRIPLPRSVETVEGMISFPVEVAWLTDGTPWERRAERTLPLPRLSAPIAVARVTLHLPPGFDERRSRRLDDRHRVDGFTEGAGISYGFVITDEEDRTRAEEADVLFQSAVDAWMDNDFDEAQQALDDLSGLGAGNDNTVRLQSNLYVVTGEGEAGGDEDGDDGVGYDGKDSAGESMKRRVREQARARADEEFREYESSMRKAEEKERAGDYSGAEADYRDALALGEKLEGLDQEESSEMEDKNMELTLRVESVSKKKKGKLDRAAKAKAPSRGPVVGRTTGSFGGGRSSRSAYGAGAVGATGSASGGAKVVVTETTSIANAHEYKPAADPAPVVAAPMPEPNEPMLLPPPVDLPAQGQTIAAANRSVLVPTMNRTVQFQQLLLPADGAHEVVVRARQIP
ncbi:MAG: hypothetical protein GY898_26195, partial [Proteobacteria bacterium]|nr:hypothetical protein [Pseudomonadota bacterium]